MDCESLIQSSPSFLINVGARPTNSCFCSFWYSKKPVVKHWINNNAVFFSWILELSNFLMNVQATIVNELMVWWTAFSEVMILDSNKRAVNLVSFCCVFEFSSWQHSLMFSISLSVNCVIFEKKVWWDRFITRRKRKFNKRQINSSFHHIKLSSLFFLKSHCKKHIS